MQSYRERLFALLGDRDPLDVLAGTASSLTEIVRTHSATVLRARPFEGQWTANEIIGHLVDGEWVYGYRLRLTLCEEQPAVLGTSQELWVARQEHNLREPAELADMFRTLRQFNLAVWKRLSPADLARTNRHDERGSESLAVMLRLTAGHDLSHLDQIARSVRVTTS